MRAAYSAAYGGEEGEEEVKDPLPEQLRLILNAVCLGSAEFLVLSDRSDSEGLTYLQTIALSEEIWYVERRSGEGPKDATLVYGDADTVLELFVRWKDHASLDSYEWRQDDISALIYLENGDVVWDEDATDGTNISAFPNPPDEDYLDLRLEDVLRACALAGRDESTAMFDAAIALAPPDRMRDVAFFAALVAEEGGDADRAEELLARGVSKPSDDEGKWLAAAFFAKRRSAWGNVAHPDAGLVGTVLAYMLREPYCHTMWPIMDTFVDRLVETEARLARWASVDEHLAGHLILAANAAARKKLATPETAAVLSRIGIALLGSDSSEKSSSYLLSQHARTLERADHLGEAESFWWKVVDFGLGDVSTADRLTLHLHRTDRDADVIEVVDRLLRQPFSSEIQALLTKRRLRAEKRAGLW